MPTPHPKTGETSGKAIGIVAFLVLLILLTLLTGAFIYFFTGIGIGLEVSHGSSETKTAAYQLFVAVAIGVLIGYLFDFDIKKTPFLSEAFVFALVIMAVIAMVLMGGIGPVCVFTLAIPTLFLGLKFVFFKNIPTMRYIRNKHALLVTEGSIVLALFIAWVASSVYDPTGFGNLWDGDTRVSYADAVGCEPDYEIHPECMNQDNGLPCFFNANKTEIEFSHECKTECIGVYNECTNAFVVWINPALAGLSLIVLGLLAKYIEPPRNFFNHHVNGVLESTALFLFILWIYSSFAGAGNGFTSMLISFAMSMVFGAVVIMTAVLWKDIGNVHSEDLIEEAMEQNEMYLDLIKGFVVLALSPLIILYLVLSVVHQLVRRIHYPCRGRTLEYKGILTQEAADFVEDFKNWNHASVLTYSVYLGIAYISFSVLAAKFTTVFLSWLIQFSSTLPLAYVTGIVVLVGLLLFMLPPIPGLPIYLTAGIVLVSVAHESLGLLLAISYATVVSLLLKLLACSIQQVIIGGFLGGSIGVRQAVAINSEPIRAMRLILSEPGITSGKVAILVGGPDWPVSVLCGILGLKLIPNLIGTLPIIVMILPVVLTGSFSYLSSLETPEDGLEYPYAGTLGTVVSAAAGGVMFYFTIAAAGALKTTYETKKDELEKLEYDEDVRKADEESAKVAAVRNRVKVWSNVPCFMKMMLILSVMLMITSFYILVAFGSECFEDYGLMYTIEENLGGDWTNIVKPLGRLALLLSVLSYVLFWIFGRWLQSATEKAMKVIAAGESTPLI